MLKRLGRLPGKLAAHARLLRQDPELLGRNLLQYTNPALFEARMVDVLHAVPMHVRFSPEDDGPARLNVLDTAWTESGLTGGPNTVINLALRVALAGVSVRLVSTVRTSTMDAGFLRRHAAALTGRDDCPDVANVSAGDPAHPLELGPRDVFLATHWTTAQQLKAVLPLMPVRQFFYMLQEWEPAFYAWSSNFALTVETYGMDFWPIVNEAMLAEYFFSQPFGRLCDPVMRERAVVFEPAVDASLFRPASGPAARPRRLLFYARPTNTRNMFGMGLMALRAVAAAPEFAGWEFLSIGSRGSLGDLDLGHGQVLRPAPWMDYAGYGDLLREADVLLCPMLSPHTSYPVLEMAACGGISVTNTFATKTKAGLEALSDNIVAVDATVAGFSAGLLAAADRAGVAAVRNGSLRMARDWGVALDPAAGRVAAIMDRLLADTRKREQA